MFQILASCLIRVFKIIVSTFLENSFANPHHQLDTFRSICCWRFSLKLGILCWIFPSDNFSSGWKVNRLLPIQAFWNIPCFMLQWFTPIERRKTSPVIQTAIKSNLMEIVFRKFALILLTEEINFKPFYASGTIFFASCMHVCECVCVFGIPLKREMCLWHFLNYFSVIAILFIDCLIDLPREKCFFS